MNSEIDNLREAEQKYNKKGRHHRKVTEPDFWKLMTTIMAFNSVKAKTVNHFYEHFPTDGLLSKDRMSRLCPLLKVKDIGGFAADLSICWTRALVPGGVMCIDESLWKFIRKQHKIANFDSETVVRYIERKPAKHGVLSYELCSFLPTEKLPYTHVMLPVTKTNDYSASEACIAALRQFKAHKPPGTPEITVCGDGAFSSQANLQEIAKLGFQYCVSVNRQWHPEIGQVSTDSLGSFEYRHLYSPSEAILFTSYQTEYSTNGNSRLMVTNSTNAYQVSFPTSSAAATSAHEHVIPAISTHEQPANDGNGKKRGRPARGSGQGRNAAPAPPTPQILTEDQRHLQFIESTTYNQISIANNQILTRSALLTLTAPQLNAHLSPLGFSGLAKLSKLAKAALLWKAQNLQHMREVSDSLETKAKKPRSLATEKILPQIALYRKHFASIDRLDIFLSNADSGMKQKYWRARLVERMIMVGLNNVRALLAENYGRLNRGSEYPYKSAAKYLELLVRFFKYREQKSVEAPYFTIHHSFP